METITNKTLHILGEILRINPYEPPRAIDVSIPPSHTETRFLVGPQFCLLSCAVLVVSFASAVAIYLYYHHYKIAGIGDPILAGLAAESVVWIPIYRLASPSLILVMPKDCRSTFGTFFLILGLACCVNDYALIFADWSIVTEAIGLYRAFAACIACLLYTSDAADE